MTVGFVPPFDALTATLGERRSMVDRSLAAGVDHIGLVDHVSFRDGQGYDGLIHAASLLSLDPALHVYLGLYLLALRHPMPVARQLATIAEIAPGRFTFAVGVGGDDRAEVENCGVDPATRGRRMDECLEVLRMLLVGDAVTYSGEYVTVHDALIKPPPSPPISIIVGGRSEAAQRRAARLGDGWLGIWVSASRYATIVENIKAQANESGRSDQVTEFGLNVWVGFGKTTEEGRRHLARGMEETYLMPFDRFEKWSPCGAPADVADFLAPYVEAGCSTFNLMARAADIEVIVDCVAEVQSLLTQ